MTDARGITAGPLDFKRQGGEVCGPGVVDQKGIVVLGHILLVEGNLCRFFSLNVLSHSNAGCRFNKSLQDHLEIAQIVESSQQMIED